MVVKLFRIHERAQTFSRRWPSIGRYGVPRGPWYHRAIHGFRRGFQIVLRADSRRRKRRRALCDLTSTYGRSNTAAGRSDRTSFSVQERMGSAFTVYRRSNFNSLRCPHATRGTRGALLSRVALREVWRYRRNPHLQTEGARAGALMSSTGLLSLSACTILLSVTGTRCYIIYMASPLDNRFFGVFFFVR